MYNDLLGTPFVFGGRSLEGMDCLGLVVEVYRRLGIAIDDAAPYDATQADNSPQIFTSMDMHMWYAVSPPYEPYDVLLFAGLDCGHAATHCGLWVGKGRILHAAQKTGVIVSRYRVMERCLIGAYRNEALSLCHA